MRERVGLARTILCATRFWSQSPSTPTLLKGVRAVVRKQGFSGPEVGKTLHALERGGFVKTGGRYSGRTIVLTEKGNRVGCANVRLAPWTNDGYPGANLRGARHR